ncbi:TPA: hypothetical protein MIM71_20365 [Klebsiella variicola]|nr:hypothetical protein [Klebsiella variicola]HBX6198883.1 hypothetical protein [Klebsiella pneumoniae]HBX9993967.1 hypothetical protein [Klebsiella variicola]
MFIAVTGLLGQVIPFEFFSGIRPAVYTKIGCRLLVNVHYMSGWISTKKQTDKFTFLSMACRLYSHLFTLFWVNKKENIFDANHYIYKLECFLETKTYITVLCFIQPLFGDTARSLCVKTESFFWWQDFAQLVVPSQKRK